MARVPQQFGWYDGVTGGGVLPALDGLRPLRTIDPLDGDLSDLEPLTEVFATARVVLIGEQTHADGRAFLAKTRLVRFLHERLGFNVLAFEAGTYDCERTEAALEGGVEGMAALALGIHGVWLTEELRPLAALLTAWRRSSAPLRCAGFDCQISSMASRDTIARDIAAGVNAVLPGRLGPRQVGMLEALARSSMPFEPQPIPSALRRARQLLRGVALIVASRSELFAERLGTREALVLAKVVDNLYRNELFTRRINAWARRQREITPPGAWWLDETDADYRRLFGLRDRIMAANLIWILEERWPGERIVGWLANGHGVRGVAGIDCTDDRFRGLVTMGAQAYRTLGDAMYMVAVTSHHGRGGVEGAISDLPQAPPGSLEAMLHESGGAQAFADLRGLAAGHSLRRRLRGQVWSRRPPMTADWGTVTDGLLHVDEMAPSHPVDDPLL